MISVIQSVRDPACEMTCRSKDLLQNNSYQRRVKRTQRASQVVTNVCAEEMVTQSYIITLLHTSFFVCMPWYVESRVAGPLIKVPPAALSRRQPQLPDSRAKTLRINRLEAKISRF